MFFFTFEHFRMIALGPLVKGVVANPRKLLLFISVLIKCDPTHLVRVGFIWLPLLRRGLHSNTITAESHGRCGVAVHTSRLEAKAIEAKLRRAPPVCAHCQTVNAREMFEMNLFSCVGGVEDGADGGHRTMDTLVRPPVAFRGKEKKPGLCYNVKLMCGCSLVWPHSSISVTL